LNIFLFIYLSIYLLTQIYLFIYLFVESAKYIFIYFYARLVQGEGLGANQIVGIMSPAPPKSAVTGTTQAVKKPLVFQGGELLNKIAFEPYLPKGKRDNIKFLF